MRTARPEPSGFAAKAKDLQALRDTVDQAATVSGALWISYVLLFFYLAIATGAVTHKDLFFENPVKLPFLGVELPLVNFFVLGPLLFLVVHAYTLLHFVMLAGKVGAFRAELAAQVGLQSDRESLRRQLPSNIFVQFLAGPPDVQSGATGFLLRLIAWISLIIGPISLLMYFEVQFLPYHDPAVSWWQRFAVVIDVLLLWALWPFIARGTNAWLRWQDFLRGRIAGLVLLSVVPALLMFTVATFPGEALHTLPAMPFVPTEWTPHRLLIAGEVDEVARRPRSLWANRLVLPGLDAIDRTKYDSEAKIAALAVTVSLRGRHLEGAVLSGSKLRKADFTGAQLSDAQLINADLREARFSCADASIRETKASPQCTDLRGASLDQAQLQAALLNGTQLQGASLNQAQLHGAELDDAQLQSALLIGTQLQGASLVRAQLHGATLDSAALHGARLDSAQLRGASLDGATLQGATLGFAEFDGASLQGVLVWRTYVPILFDVPIVGDHGVYAWNVIKEARESTACMSPETCDWSKKSYLALIQLIQKTVPAGRLQEDALSRISRLNPDQQVELSNDFWISLEKNSLTQDEYRRSLVEILQRIGCGESGIPYIVQGLSHQIQYRFGDDSVSASKLAAAFLDEAGCPGARGLSGEDQMLLQTIRDGTGIRSFAPRAE